MPWSGLWLRGRIGWSSCFVRAERCPLVDHPQTLFAATQTQILAFVIARPILTTIHSASQRRNVESRVGIGFSISRRLAMRGTGSGGTVNCCEMPVCATSLPDAELGRFRPDQIAFAASAWPLRAAEELRSALIYRALAAASRIALPTFANRFRIVGVEEVGHARLCATVGAKLGCQAPKYSAQSVRDRLNAVPDPRSRTIALVISEVAIGETISMAMFRESRRSTTEPLSLAAITSILADESRHHQLGWEALAVLDHHPMTHLEVTRALAACEQQIAVPALRFLKEGKVFDPVWAELGVIEPSRRVDAFYLAIEELVIPKLLEVGIDGAAAWAQRYHV